MSTAWIQRDPRRRPTQQENTGHAVFQAARDGQLRRSLLQLIDDAESMIVLSTFILADKELVDHLLEAADRQVRVYILTSSEEQLTADPAGEIAQERIAKYKDSLTRIASRCLLRSAAGFHAKALLIDPRTDPRGMLLTANAVQSDLLHNDEAAVLLQPSEVSSVFEILRWAFWERAERQLLEAGTLEAVVPLGRLHTPPEQQPVLKTTELGDEIAAQICDGIRNHDRIIVSNYGFDERHPVVAELVSAAHRGCDVTVVARASEKCVRSVPALTALVRGGVNVRATDRMHAKLACFDESTAIIQTGNFTDWVAPSRLELGLELKDERAKVLIDIAEKWTADSRWQLVVDAEFPQAGAMRMIDLSDGGWELIPQRS